MRRALPFAVIGALASSCAQVRDLQGGEKDVVPPMLVAAVPPDGTVRFGDDRVVLRFSERIRAEKILERLIVSPPLDKAPDLRVSGDELVMQLRSPLAANTTYTFNFGDAVVDITEGNPAVDLEYVVSTGEVLDSLGLHGSVADAFLGTPVEGAQVQLYTDTDSTGFTTGRPAYFTRSRKDGSFRIAHLREGHYQVRALGDLNADHRFDLPGEQVAFVPGTIAAGDTGSIPLRMFTGEAQRQRIDASAVLVDRAWQLVLARSTDTLRIRDVDRTGGVLRWAEEWNPTRDTLLAWPSDTAELDGIHFELSDSSGVIDTLVYRVQKPMPFYVSADAAGTCAEGWRTFRASRPLARIDTERMLRRKGEALVSGVVTIEAPSRSFRMACDDASDEGVLTLLPGALHDIYGATNDTIRIQSGRGAVDEAGDLRIKLTADSALRWTGPFIVQLISGTRVVSSERFERFPHAIDRPGAAAGSYTLKVIEDNDGNGRWTTGSLSMARQPERVFLLAEEIVVRTGWEVVVDRVVH